MLHLPRSPFTLALTPALQPFGRWLSRGNCRVCGQWQSELVCLDCQDVLTNSSWRCIRCGLDCPELTGPGATCSVCLDYPPELDTVIVGTDFCPPWSGLISGLKFRQQPSSAKPLVDKLVTAIHAHTQAQPDQARPDLILPIPLSRARWRERGFNQAWWLAQQTAQQLKLSNRLHPEILRRPHDTGRLMNLDASERTGRIQGAFELIESERYRIEGQHVVIVDDVMTTGATANEACRILRMAGASSVTGWFAARTPRPTLQTRVQSAKAS